MRLEKVFLEKFDAQNSKWKAKLDESAKKSMDLLEGLVQEKNALLEALRMKVPRRFLPQASSSLLPRQP